MLRFGPHAALQSSQGAYCYDARGNQIAGPNRSISYSIDNKPLVITSNGQASEFRYDPDHRRFYQSSPERSTYYLDEGQFEEVSEGGQVLQNTYASGYLQHQKNLSSGTSSLKYKLNDQLGSVDVVLDAQGQVLERLAYAPFGGRRGADWSNNAAPMQESRRGFTGHEHLEESKLIHMNGRVYDPSLGRFLSADIVYQDATNAQMFNRYAYGFNSPFSGTDPSGYVWYNPLSWDWMGSRNLKIPGQSFFSPIATQVPWATGYGLGSKLVNSVTISNFKSYANSSIASFKSASVKDDLYRAISAFPASNRAVTVAGFISSAPAVLKTAAVLAPIATVVKPTAVLVDDIPHVSAIPSAGGVIRQFEQTGDKIYYRVFSGNATAGSWLTAVPPKSSAWAQEALALPRSNQANMIQEVLVPSGTLMERSRAIPMPEWGRLRGGAEQFQLIDKIPIKNFGPGSPLP